MDMGKARHAVIVCGCLLAAACGGSSGSDSGGGGGQDLPSVSIDSPTVQEGDSGTVDMTFTLTLSEAAPGAASVRYETADGEATAGEDYTAVSGILDVAAGDTSATVVVPILGDVLDEADETFTLELSDATGATLVTRSATGTIRDDDGPPALSSEAVTVTEGDADDVTASFELVLGAPSARTVSVSYATADGSATAGEDYEAVSGDVSFAPGETSQTVAVTVFGDGVDESAETFTLELSGAQNATLVNASVTATIVDNDGVPSLSIGGVTVAEDAATASFPVTLSNPAANPVTVDYTTVDGTAVAGQDYEAVAATLTFPAGETAGSVTVAVLDDTVDEDSESFSVTLSNAANADIAVGTAAATINDNDSAARIAVADATVTEGDAGSVDLEFAVSLSAPSGRPVSVGYATVDGTATEGEDYAGVTGTVDFAPGETAATVTVGVVGDTLDEADETLTLALSNPVNADLGDAEGTGTILDDDTPPSLTLAEATVSEGDAGTVLLNFDLNLDAPSGRTISVAYATADGTASAGDDYTPASATLTLDPGETAATITVEVLGDTLDEADETLTVALSNPDAVTLADTEATGTIQDDDEPPALSIADASLVEGDSGSAPMAFAVSLDAESGRSVTVEYATADGSATAAEDYTGTAGSLTFDPGVTEQTIEVPVLGDTAAESDETFAVTLSAPANATLADAEATGTIRDDQDGSGGGGPVSGLSQRPSNATCLAGDAPALATGIDTAVAFPDLPAISQPIALRQLPGDASHWYLAQKGGVIVRFENRADVASVTTFVDIDARVNSGANEAGLLGMAFHPDFATNGEVYLSYTASGLTSRISRFTSPDGGVTLDPNSEEILLTLNQPFSNHNGGNILFGPDGYLYIGFGDGGSGGDPGDRAQNTTNLFGAMLRIDVDNGSPYGIPSDNPFAANASCSSGSGAAACPEIYAWGFRNPWRWSFDAGTGELWVGDVGQNSWEEVDVVELGGNYGWRCREGAHDFNTSGNCPDGLIDPVIEYDHGVGRSITGGYVYRGSAIPELEGRYVFADLNGKIFASVSDGAGGYGYETLLATGNSIVSFAEDENGELLYLDFGANTVRRIVQAGGSSTGTVADQLSETGCVDSADPTQPASALIPYAPIAAFWSDGAAKERWYSLPDGATVDVDAESDWVFPIGSVIVKNFRLGGDLIETRLFMRHNDGDWAGYTYEWNDTQTEATRVVGGKTKDIGGQTWIYPSGAECLECHTQVAGDTLGLEHAQLNGELTYPSTGITANQLVTADEIDVLTAPLADVPDNLPRLADPTDTSAPLEERARAYLHTNCANCHQPNGPTPSNIDLRYATPLAQTNTCGVEPLQGDLGIANARIIAPGDAVRSLLVVRTNRRDVHGMPPLGSNLVDTAGVQLLTEWVNSLAGCP